jgi:NADH:ubiquinone oxidoreductase subunit 5 (subunit L)/multisubunit Na+/H+ antiporter MnhA subunit
MEIMWMIYETIVLEAVIEWKWYKIVNFSSMTIENKIIISKENILIVWLVTIITISVLIYTVYYMGKPNNSTPSMADRRKNEIIFN